MRYFEKVDAETEHASVKVSRDGMSVRIYARRTGELVLECGSGFAMHAMRALFEAQAVVEKRRQTLIWHLAANGRER